MQSIDSSPEISSDSDDGCNFYSGAAKRFKLHKDVLYPTGQIQLVEKTNTKMNNSARNRSPSPVVVSDSSDEEIFRDLDATNKEEEEDMEGSQEFIQKRVETLEDIEEFIHLSPDPSCDSVEDKRTQSAASIIAEEGFEEIDPLGFTTFNDSDLNHKLDDDEKVMVKVQLSSVIYRIQITRAQYFKILIQELANKVGIDSNKICLEFKDEPLDPYGSLKTVPIGITDIIEATVVNEAVIAPTDNTIELKVQSQTRSSQVVISIRPEESMNVLMQKYADATSTDRAKMIFKFDGDVLEEDDTPTSLDLEGGECIDVFIKE